ncbi:MAG: hypothetical protein EBR82_66960 [Caulobacteraceae bacterium]|nr:hypothetical protein [Caulobacteraceae bacterium]
MRYEEAVDLYWRKEMRAGRPRLRICQPNKSLSKKTRHGWKLYNIRGFLAEIKNPFAGIDFAKNAENAETWLAAKVRLNEIRKSINAENVSWGELAELASLAEYIEPGDVQLLEWAGVPEFNG